MILHSTHWGTAKLGLQMIMVECFEMSRMVHDRIDDADMVICIEVE